MFPCVAVRSPYCERITYTQPLDRGGGVVNALIRFMFEEAGTVFRLMAQLAHSLKVIGFSNFYWSSQHAHPETDFRKYLRIHVEPVSFG